jgi:peroxiredoxin/uncharacterized membrane protein YphA (DoxX/SURF4 family)
MSGLLVAIRLLLAVMFGVAGVAKLADRDGSRHALQRFGAPPLLADAGSVGLPVLELLIAVGLLVPISAWSALIAATALLIVFASAIGLSVARGTAADCHCFGQLHSEPAGWGALARNGALIAACSVALIGGAGAARLSPVAWLTGANAVELTLGSIALVLLIALGVEGWFLLELSRQHGRILTRLETLESYGPPQADRQRPLILETGAAGNGNGQVRELQLGMEAPPFELLDVDGRRVSLAQLCSRGQSVALVFTDPACGACEALLPTLAERQRRYHGQLTLALISRGGAESNRADSRRYGLHTVLLQDDREIADRYKVHGTPAAVLVSADGYIATAVAVGAPAITTILDGVPAGEPTVVSPHPGKVHRTHGSPSPLPHRLPVGTLAPDRAWHDIDGRLLSLRRSFGGQWLVILFWNPACSACSRILTDLRAWESDETPRLPRLLVVSTGDLESNRAMHLRARIVLEDGFETARHFGAAGTPAAVGIDGSGRVATSIAVGGPAVLTFLAAHHHSAAGPSVVSVLPSV